ncbi:helix-turn-helix domain-containing protein [Mumia quercus]|uniref:helix-turn-helix domain-containing protein n=1 Tax=Mumia quercus TaxID=2976125 RepID=UPI0021D39EC9|nr:helix-turn-helix domain-containing protein [Mumia quercus]
MTPHHRATTVGDLLRSHRIERDLTLEQLAERSGVSDRAISDIERGVSRRPRTTTVRLLADALALGTDERERVVVAARESRHGLVRVGTHPLPLPPAVRHFVGRRAEASDLVRRLGPGSGHDDSPSIAVVTGAPGIGKTALAARAAGSLAHTYDGTLFLDLGALGSRPLDPQRALRHLIAAARPTDGPLPDGLAEVRALWDETFARRQLLVVLDDARDESQVRPLLPRAGPGAVAVTSRRSLAGLEGVHRLDLPALAERESVALLQHIVEDVGPGQSPGARPAELAALARLCEHTPLALRAAGSRLAARRGGTVADLIRRLQSRDRRLSVLTAGDLVPAAVVAPSYDQLSPTAQTLLRRLGATEGTTFCPSLAAVLLDTDLWIAEDAVDELVEVGFARPAGGGAFEMHGLVKLFAHALHSEEGGPLHERREVAARAREWLQFARPESARGEARLG